MGFRHIFGHVFGIEAAVASAVFVLVAATITVAALGSRRRRRADAAPSQVSENDRLEFGYLAVVAVVAAALVILSFASNARETSDPPARPALTVRVTSFQWCWRFTYLGRAVTVTGQCAGHVEPTLVLPAHKLVRIEVTSTDVIHSFWVPYLRFKLDAFPGHVGSFVLTLAHTGRWAGRCAQFCGLFHFQMDFYVKGVSPPAFSRWIDQRAKATVTGSRT